jgi:hypothetical protein
MANPWTDERAYPAPSEPLADVFCAIAPYLFGVLVLATAIAAAEEYVVRTRGIGARPHSLAIAWIAVTTGWALSASLAAVMMW